MNKLIIYIFVTIISLQSFAQEWSDYIHGIDSIWNMPTTTVSPISMEVLYNYKDSILYMGGGFFIVIAL